MRARRVEADLGHHLLEQLAVFALVDGSALAPIISTPYFSSTPVWCSAIAVLSAVWPPRVGSKTKPSGSTFAPSAMIFSTIPA